MELLEVRALAEELIHDRGFAGRGWTVTFDRATRRAAFCKESTKEIILSVYAMRHYSEAEVEQIVLHELGHAKLGVGGHGPAWRQAVIELGGTPRKFAPQAPGPADLIFVAACLISTIMAGYQTGPVWLVIGIIVSIIAIWVVAWRRLGPVELVYNLRRP